jgi:anti-anti-sigma regulatory factor
VSALRIGHVEVTIDGSHVVLVGRIDEATPLGELAEHLAPGDVTIDASGVSFVNSVGLREWMRLVRALSARGAVTLQRVADPLMTQMNLISEFSGRVRIASFHAPYVCPKCGAEAAPLVDVDAHLQALAALQPPPFTCSECGTAMELGDLPERYLSIFRGK